MADEEKKALQKRPNSEIVSPSEVPYLPSKPKDQLRKEYQIRQSLIEQGVDREIADSVIGYRPGQIPYIYRSRLQETIDGNSRRPMTSELWIGTTDAIHDLDLTWGDQTPEVIVQWWGHTRTDEDKPRKRVERLEVHHMSDGRFVEIQYHGVSEMGEFDGEIGSISVNIPDKPFHPWGGERERKTWRIYSFRHKERGSDYGDESVPWKRLQRKGEGPEEWIIDLSSTNVTGTSILNGLEQMVNFHLPDIKVAKADPSKAYRLTPPPESKQSVPLLSMPKKTAEESGRALTTPETRELVESLRPQAAAMMGLLAPMVQDVLAKGGWRLEVEGMMTDGILKHPEKIQVLGKLLSDFTREQRFRLAQAAAQAVQNGQFSKWMATLSEEKSANLISDTARRNTDHLLDWFARSAHSMSPERQRQWLAAAEGAVIARSKGERIEPSEEFAKCFDGMCTSFVERYIEYIGQMILGNALTP